MFRNYFKVALRNLWKNKGLSFINIFGLAAGLACTLLIYLFVSDELSYDRFHHNPENIYRVVKDFVNDDGSRLPDATTPPALAHAMQKEIPGVERVTRVFPGWGSSFLISYKENKFNEEKLFRVDSSFFEVFNFPFKQGDPVSAFKNTRSVMITESVAKKYFGKEYPMGKTLHIDRLGNMAVAGILKDPPETSHFHFDFLIPLRNFGTNLEGNWGWYNFYTYVRLSPHTNVTSLQPKIQKLYHENVKDGKNIFYTQALTDIHLGSALKWEIEPNSDKLYVYVFSIVGIFILLIASINYINLVTARSALRAKEVGIRKTSGATNGALIRQFLLESVVLSLLASAFALILAQLLLPVVNSITGKNLTLFGSPDLLAAYFLLGSLGVGLMAGLFPALYLASFKPVVVLKVNKVKQTGLFNLRKALVITQFSISIALIAGSLIIYQQIQFIKSASLGLNKDQVLVIKEFGALSLIERENFENSLVKLPGVAASSSADGIVGGQNWTTSLNAKGSTNSQLINFLSVGTDFLKVLDIKMKEGRSFSKEFPADSMNFTANNFKLDQVIGSIILNEKAVHDLGVPSPHIGQLIAWSRDGDTTYYLKLVGVTKDFHFASMKNEIKPFAFIMNNNRVSNLTLKLSSQNMPSAMDGITRQWKAVAPGRPLQYFFLDETYARLYQSETNFQKLFFVLVVLSIVIACLGLFGLAAFTAQQRTKEIGIRKVLGASVAGITALLSRDFLKLVLISVVIATPVTWWAMSRWLDNYTYRIQISWLVFIMAGILAVIIALATVSFQSLRSAMMNPVTSLRSE